MLNIRFAACLTVASLLLCASMPPAAALPLPKPREDVTKLDKPTIAYSTEGAYEIRLMDWDGGNDRLWMGDGKARFSGSADWSPDGKRAIVVVYDEDEWNYIPYLLDLRTGKVRNMLEWLPNANGFFTHPSWSPDGKWVAIIDTWYNQNALIRSNIYKVNVLTGKHVQLTNFPAREPGVDVVSWSPDGQKIAFDALEEPMLAFDVKNVNYEIYVMNSDGSNIVNLTDHPKGDLYPSWSPDGRKILFGTMRDDPFDLILYMMNSDGSGVERFMEDGSYIGPAVWSPDSKWIAYFGGSVDPNNPKPIGVYLAHVETRKKKLIKRDAGFPTWVMAGKSRFLSIDPSGKKHEQWGDVKEADAEAPQENASEE